jgi:hypothetical protein
VFIQNASVFHLNACAHTHAHTRRGDHDGDDDGDSSSDHYPALGANGQPLSKKKAKAQKIALQKLAEKASLAAAHRAAQSGGGNGSGSGIMGMGVVVSAAKKASRMNRFGAVDDGPSSTLSANSAYSRYAMWATKMQ